MSDKQYVMAVGSDDAGVHLKDYIRDRLREDPRVREVHDFGVADTSDETAYPIICIKAAEAVARGEIDRAVLFGGTGLGEAISANKVRGIRAAVAVDPFSIERSILSNNCQILCLGERVVAPELASRIVSQWLGYEFDPSSPSAAKVKVITDYEEHGSLLLCAPTRRSYVERWTAWTRPRAVLQPTSGAAMTLADRNHRRCTRDEVAPLGCLSELLQHIAAPTLAPDLRILRLAQR